jgi:hypothetical protein
MAGTVAPNIVTDGLVLYLDAANTKSYPGSGTTWFDISGNNRNFTLTNGPTFQSTGGGSFKFDGTDDYATLNIANDNPMKIENFIYANHTYEVWFYLSTFTPSLTDNTEQNQALICWPGNHNGIFFGRTSPSSSVNIVTNYLWNSSRNSIFYTETILTGSNVNTVTTGSWFCIHDIIDYTNTKSFTYINGVNVNTRNDVPLSSMTSDQGSPANVINIGAARITSNYKLLLQNGNISCVKLYNKALNAQEVLQNYNSQKTRIT